MALALFGGTVLVWGWFTVPHAHAKALVHAVRQPINLPRKNKATESELEMLESDLERITRTIQK